MRRRDRGSILVVALLVLVSITFIVLTLARETRVEVQVAARAVDDVRTRALVDSAVDRALAVLQAQTDSGDTLQALWRDDEANFRAVPLGAGKMWVCFGEPDPGDGRELRWGIRDEAAKLNVNTATRDQLLGIPGMTEEIADAIIDWRDEDDDESPSGCESSYYNTLSPPYEAKNGPIESVEELLRIRQIDEAVLYGEDRNRNGLLDPGEDDADRSFPPDDANGQLGRGLADYLTVYSFDQNETKDGRARLVIAGANPVELGQRLATAGMAQDMVQRTVQFLVRRPPNAPPIQSVGQLLDVQGMDEDNFAIVADELASTDTARIPGRININTASPDVIRAALPDLTEDDVQAILSRRVSTGEDLSSPAWLLRALPKQKLQQIFEQITTKSWQFTIHAAVALDDRPAVIRRVEIVVDKAYAPVRVLWRRDLTPLGFPLPKERGENNP